MAVATAPTSAVLLPRSSSSCFPSAGGRAVRRHQQGEGQKRQQRVRGVLATNILRIIRQDREFIATKLEPVAAPIRQVGNRVSKALDDFFWLRFLEKEGASTTRGQPPSRPNPSYPGLSGMDLLMADLEALKLYAGYLYYMSNCWSVPLPETYDLETVEEYFKCRPHILAVRVFEVRLLNSGRARAGRRRRVYVTLGVLSSFASAAIRVQVLRSEFKSQRLNQDKNGDASQYYMGQLLKESMLKLGPTFIKG
ncbi:hypothetical protein Taro_024922 [Colocasia esculenta]|uniref:Uncharacterized protein n=1 Tax=Colocasia esculenta TaxID=4460 RepID=A0A843VLT7_COLES|nr:hypothetical protein [Colocasia esculenta]